MKTYTLHTSWQSWPGLTLAECEAETERQLAVDPDRTVWMIPEEDSADDARLKAAHAAQDSRGGVGVDVPIHPSEVTRALRAAGEDKS